jgi:hypothetical protein
MGGEGVLESVSYIRGWVVCVRWVGPYVWGETQPLTYIYVHLTLHLLEQPFPPPNITDSTYH